MLSAPAHLFITSGNAVYPSITVELLRKEIDLCPLVGDEEFLSHLSDASGTSWVDVDLL